MESSTLLQDEHDHDDLGEFFVSLTDDEPGHVQSSSGPYRDSRPIL